MDRAIHCISAVTAAVDFFELKGVGRWTRDDQWWRRIERGRRQSWRESSTCRSHCSWLICGYLQGQTASVSLNGEVVLQARIVGDVYLHPKLAREFDLPKPLFLADLH